MDEVGDLIKSKKNLIYLLSLKGILTRLLYSSAINNNPVILEKMSLARKKIAEEQGYHCNPLNSKNERDSCDRYLGRS